MTNEELQTIIAKLRAAYERGEIEEQYTDNGWRKFDGQGMFLGKHKDNYHYRIKPQPREVYIPKKDIGLIDSFIGSWPNVATKVHATERGDYILFREVVE